MVLRMKRTLSLMSVLCSLATALAGCGGGGGGGSSDEGDFVGAANVSIHTTPGRIDTGDRTETSIELSNVHENGIALKIRYPEGLRYVPGSAFLLIDKKEIDISPTVNATAKGENETFLVFYLSQSQFKRSGQKYTGQSGTVVLQLEGQDSVVDGEIEVDPDVDDPAEDNSTEFNIDTPEFVAEDSAAISVVIQ
jgi:hypothetical protein